jgi:type II restriction/modification system DNA methylase subunit YeeA
MNKTAIKNFAIWARRKLIADISYRAGLMGITEDGIKDALPQSTGTTEFYDIGTAKPYSISGEEVKQRKRLVEVIRQKEADTDYKTAYQYIIEEVAYTWFNRMIAVRFMEVNEYLPSRIRVLSSETGKVEPDLVTTPFDADLSFTEEEKAKIYALKDKADKEASDELFSMLFIKQCNALNEILPNLFEKTSDYTELLLNLSVIDEEGVVYHLVHDIEEKDFNVELEGQVEIIGWLYQYYNTEPKDETFALLKKNVKITKERIPSATQLFTPDWIVRYMVENSLGRLWLEGHPDEKLKAGWKYYLEEAEQELEVQAQLDQIRTEYKNLNPEDIKVIDPCMGSGHILVYCFDVLMQIYEAQGYSQRDAAQSILEHNLYGLDIDDRAAQLAYFAVMMKARQYDRRIFTREIKPHIYAIQESNNVNRHQLQYFGAGMNDFEKNTAFSEMEGLLDTLTDAKEYGSILNVDKYDWDLLCRFAENVNSGGQMSFDSMGLDDTQELLLQLIGIGQAMAQKYDVVVTNPPYMGGSGMSAKLSEFVKKNYPDSKTDLFAVFIEKSGDMAKKNGYQAMITQHAWMFLSSFEKLRAKLLAMDTINMAHLGARAFEEIGGEVVQTTSFVLCRSHVAEYKGTYCRLIEPTTQQRKEMMFLSRENRYFANQTDFSIIPGAPIAYWVTKDYLKVFRSKTMSDYGVSCIGMRTGDNERFLRLWSEVNLNKVGIGYRNAESARDSGRKWFPYCKGGSFRKWYGNNDYVVNWENDGFEIKENTRRVYPYLGDNLSWKISNEPYYFRKGLTWSGVGAKVFGVRSYPDGMIFDSGANSYFVKNDKDYLYFAGLLNCVIMDDIINIVNPTINTGCGVIAQLPAIKPSTYNESIEKLVEQCIEMSKYDWDSFETSWDFHKHPLVALAHKTTYKNNGVLAYRIADGFDWWNNECETRFNQLQANEEELNRIFLDIYGLQNELPSKVERKNITVRKADLQRDIKSLLSYAVGCMFGRYSLDMDGLAYAGGEWDDSKYTTFLPDQDNVIPITDEEYFDDDIVGLLCAWLKKVYGADTLEENLDFIASALGNKGNSSVRLSATTS